MNQQKWEVYGSIQVYVNPLKITPATMQKATDPDALRELITNANADTLMEELNHASAFNRILRSFSVTGYGSACSEDLAIIDATRKATRRAKERREDMQRRAERAIDEQERANDARDEELKKQLGDLLGMEIL